MIRAALLIFVLAAPAFGQYVNSWNTQSQCGTVSHNATKTGTTGLEGKYPWHVAILINDGAGKDEFKCGGTLVSRRHVITTANCVTWENTRDIFDKNTLTLYVDKFDLSNQNEGTPILFLKKITIHPNYNEVTQANNLAIIELRESISYLVGATPICLWPEDLIDFTNVIYKTGSVLGWGYDSILKTNRGLKLMEIPIVDKQVCITLDEDYYTPRVLSTSFCAGNKDGTTTRNSNTGEGMVFNNDDTWYLRGVTSDCKVLKDTNTCDPKTYVVFMDIARYLPWIRESLTITN